MVQGMANGRDKALLGRFNSRNCSSCACGATPCTGQLQSKCLAAPQHSTLHPPVKPLQVLSPSVFQALPWLCTAGVFTRAAPGELLPFIRGLIGPPGGPEVARFLGSQLLGALGRCLMEGESWAGGLGCYRLCGLGPGSIRWGWRQV